MEDSSQNQSPLSLSASIRSCHAANSKVSGLRCFEVCCVHLMKLDLADTFSKWEHSQEGAPLQNCHVKFGLTELHQWYHLFIKTPGV